MNVDYMKAAMEVTNKVGGLPNGWRLWCAWHDCKLVDCGVIKDGCKWSRLVKDPNDNRLSQIETSLMDFIFVVTTGHDLGVLPLTTVGHDWQVFSLVLDTRGAGRENIMACRARLEEYRAGGVRVNADTPFGVHLRSSGKCLETLDCTGLADYDLGNVIMVGSWNHAISGY